VKTQLVSISKLQTSKVMAALYLVMSIPLVLIMAVSTAFSPEPMPGWLLILLPLVYAVTGFVFTFFGAWIYNGIAGAIGGVEFTAAPAAERD